MEWEAESQIELYDSDLVKIRKIFHYLNEKYTTKKDSKENLLSLVHEAEDLFEGAGFKITAAVSRQMLWAIGASGQGAPAFFTFSIDERIGQSEFDHDKMGWEVRHQLIDDRVAKKFIGQGGTFKDVVPETNTDGEVVDGLSV